MEYVMDLVQAFGTPTSLMAFMAYCLYKNKKFDDKFKLNEERLTLGSEKFRALEDNFMITGKFSMIQAIVNTKLPLIERARAFQVYKDMFNGNGAIEQYYKEKIEPNLSKEFLNHDT